MSFSYVSLGNKTISDEQIRLSSGKVKPRLWKSTWVPDFKNDKEPMIEIDFRKQTMVRKRQKSEPLNYGESQFDLHRRAKTKNHAAQHDTKNAFRAEPRV